MSIEDDFFNFGLKFTPTLKKLCQPIFDYFGLTKSIVINISTEGTGYATCSHPEIISHYLSNNFITHDPRIVRCDNIGAGTSFASSYNTPYYQDTVLGSLQDIYGMHHMFTITRKKPGSYRLYGFSSDKENTNIFNKLLSESTLMHASLDMIDIQLDSHTHDHENLGVDMTALREIPLIHRSACKTLH